MDKEMMESLFAMFQPPQQDAQLNSFAKVLSMQVLASGTMKKLQKQNNPNVGFLISDIAKGLGTINGIGAGMDMSQLLPLLSFFGPMLLGKDKPKELAVDNSKQPEPEFVTKDVLHDVIDVKFEEILAAVNKIKK